MGEKLRYVSERIDLYPLGESGFGCIFCRNKKLLYAALGGVESHRQSAAYSPHFAGEAQLTDEGCVLRQRFQLSAAEEYAQHNGQVVYCSRLFCVGGSKVDGETADREAQSGGFDGGADALARLLDGGIGETHYIKGGQTVGEEAFAAYLITAYTLKTHRTDTGYHLFLTSQLLL